VGVLDGAADVVPAVGAARSTVGLGMVSVGRNLIDGRNVIDG
jgi:hypothetical protein